METIEVSEKNKRIFKKILFDCKAIIKPSDGENLGGKLYREELSNLTYYDLDVLWLNPKCRSELMNVLTDVASKLNQTTNYDTIVPIVSSIGAFGPTPWASILAYKLEKKLVILDEFQFRLFRKYPITISPYEVFQKSRVMLFKDIIVHGRSVEMANKFIKTHGGEVSAFLTLIDTQPLNRLFNFTDMEQTFSCVLYTPTQEE